MMGWEPMGGSDNASEEPWPETFEAVMAVAGDKRSTLILAAPTFLGDWLDGPHVEDCGFTETPTEPGVYRCVCTWHWEGDDEYTFPVLEATRVLEYPPATGEAAV